MYDYNITDIKYNDLYRLRVDFLAPDASYLCSIRFEKYFDNQMDAHDWIVNYVKQKFRAKYLNFTDFDICSCPTVILKSTVGSYQISIKNLNQTETVEPEHKCKCKPKSFYKRFKDLLLGEW